MHNYVTYSHNDTCNSGSWRLHMLIAATKRMQRPRRCAHQGAVPGVYAGYMNRAPKSQFERNLHLSTCSLLCTGIDTVEPPRGNVHTHIWMAVWVSSRNLASTSRHVKHSGTLSEPFSTECSDEPVDKERSSRIVIHLQNQTMLTLAAGCTYSFLIEAPDRTTQ